MSFVGGLNASTISASLVFIDTSRLLVCVCAVAVVVVVPRRSPVSVVTPALRFSAWLLAVSSSPSLRWVALAGRRRHLAAARAASACDCWTDVSFVQHAVECGRRPDGGTSSMRSRRAVSAAPTCPTAVWPILSVDVSASRAAHRLGSGTRQTSVAKSQVTRSWLYRDGSSDHFVSGEAPGLLDQYRCTSQDHIIINNQSSGCIGDLNDQAAPSTNVSAGALIPLSSVAIPARRYRLMAAPRATSPRRCNDEAKMQDVRMSSDAAINCQDMSEGSAVLQVVTKPSSTAHQSKTASKIKRVSFGSPGQTLVETRLFNKSQPDIVRVHEAPLAANATHMRQIVRTRGLDVTSSSSEKRTPTAHTGRPLLSPCCVVTSLVSSEHSTDRHSTERQLTERHSTERQLTDVEGGTSSSTPRALTPATPDSPRHVIAVTSFTNAAQVAETCDLDWENPFRPQGELSQAADLIVHAIRRGRNLDQPLSSDSPLQQHKMPLAPDPQSTSSCRDSTSCVSPTSGKHRSPTSAVKLRSSTPSCRVVDETRSPAADTDGTTQQCKRPVLEQPGPLQVQHHKVESQVSHAERVTLSGERGGHCCVMQ